MDEGSFVPRPEGRARRHNGAPGLPAGIPAGPRGWRVYPSAVVRLAGEPFDALAAFHSPRSLHHHALLDAREREAADALAKLTRRLHEAVGAAGADERRSLLAAARNLRREGKLSAGQEAAARAAADGGALARVVDAWRRRERNADEARAALEQVHQRETADSRVALRAAAGGTRFRAGIVLSSAPFHEQLRAWLARPEAVDRRLERALLRYLTRAASKTTPFSTFTSLAVARLDPDGVGALLALEDGDEPRSSMSVNKSLYALLIPILCETPELHPLFGISANPSLRLDGDRHSMLLARDGREHVVAFPASDFVGRCVELVRGSGGTMPYGALAAALGGAAGAAAAAPGVIRMIGAGILQLDSGIADRDTAWLPRLLEVLAPSGHPTAVHIRVLLRELRETADAYAAADPDGRHALLARAREALRAAVWGPPVSGADGMPDASAEPGKATGPWMRARGRELTVQELLATPLYEDTFFARPARVDARRLAPALGALATWVDCVSRVTPVWAQRASLRAYHDRAFAGPVPFPVFYERYFADVFEPVLRREREGNREAEGGDAETPGAEPLREANAAAEALRRTLAARWAADPDAEFLPLTRHDYPAADAPTLRPDVPVSAIVFAQLVEAAEAGDATPSSSTSRSPTRGWGSTSPAS
jgi:hypothetical protein